MVHGLEEQYCENINFAYLDIEDPATDFFKQALGYQYQPHLFLLDENGNILKEWVGPVSEDELVASFEEALAE